MTAPLDSRDQVKELQKRGIATVDRSPKVEDNLLILAHRLANASNTYCDEGAMLMNRQG